MSAGLRSMIDERDRDDDGLKTYLDESAYKNWSPEKIGSPETSPMLDHCDVCPVAQEELEAEIDLLNCRKIRYALGICVAFFFVELVSGFLTHSLAILSDSFHLLSDISGFVLTLLVFYLSRRPATSRHSYGFYRIEVLGALGSTFMIWGMTGTLVWEAVERIKNPVDINAPMMFVTAAAGLAVNIIIGFVLNTKHGISVGVCRDAHSHDAHSHDANSKQPSHGSPGKRPFVFPQKVQSEQGEASDVSADRVTRRIEKNINIQSASIHVIGDIISSTGVLIASTIIMFNPSLVIIDPICTFVFSILVISTTFKIIKNSLVILMEATPVGIESPQVHNDLLSIKGVKDVHDLHIWNLTLGKPSLSVHLHVANPSPLYPGDSDSLHTPFEKEYTRILSAAQNLVCSKYGIHHVTIQIETDEYQISYGSQDEGIAVKTDDTESSPSLTPKQTLRYQLSTSRSNLFQKYRPHCDNAMCRVGIKK